PYRMLTSRAEFRLILRPDTADRRLSDTAASHSLISTDRHADVAAESAQIDAVIAALESSWLGDNPRHAQALTKAGLKPARRSMTAMDLARRPGVRLERVIAALEALGMWNTPSLAPHVLSRTQVAVQYSAFIDKEQREAERHKAAEDQAVPDSIDFSSVAGIRVEAAQRLAERPPATIAQARRTPGVTPTDIGALLVHIRRYHGATHTSQAATP
ncbi:MAG TPA: hypothetical protein VGR22_03515, partial [Thermomicrobiales bacterium]|nr:hypothetical protein [Thermomicrobiales bacterium]